MLPHSLFFILHETGLKQFLMLYHVVVFHTFVNGAVCACVGCERMPIDSTNYYVGFRPSSSAINDRDTADLLWTQHAK